MDEIRREDRQLEEKDRLIGVLECRLATLETHALLLPPVEFTVSNYSQHKGTDTRVDGPPFRNMAQNDHSLVRAIRPMSPLHKE